MATPIDCAIYDHLEIACLYHYDLIVTLRDGTCMEGRAETTATPPNRTENLQLVVDNAPTSVAMHELAWVDVQTAGAQFQSLDFAKGPS